LLLVATPCNSASFVCVCVCVCVCVYLCGKFCLRPHDYLNHVKDIFKIDAFRKCMNGHWCQSPFLLSIIPQKIVFNKNINVKNLTVLPQEERKETSKIFTFVRFLVTAWERTVYLNVSLLIYTCWEAFFFLIYMYKEAMFLLHSIRKLLFHIFTQEEVIFLIFTFQEAIVSYFRVPGSYSFLFSRSREL
jgi:hypothetical protein